MNSHLVRLRKPLHQPHLCGTGHALLSRTHISLGVWQQVEGHSQSLKRVMRGPHSNGMDSVVLKVQEHIFSRENRTWMCDSFDCWWESSDGGSKLLPMWTMPGFIPAPFTCIPALFPCIPVLFPCIPALFTCIPVLFTCNPVLFAGRSRGGFPAWHYPSLCSPAYMLKTQTQRSVFPECC